MILKEAAAVLGNVSPETLRIQIAKGKLRAEKRGRDWWVRPAEVERYRREHLGKTSRARVTGPAPSSPVLATGSTRPTTS